MDSQKKTKLLEDLDDVKSAATCSEHPEENLEFYSFTNDKLLCAECLVSGNFVGHEVVNIKRATEKIKATMKKLSEEFTESLEKNGKWQNSVNKNKEELGKSLEELEKEVKGSFAELKELIDKREKEIIEDIQTIRTKREAEMDKFQEAIVQHEKDISGIKGILEKRSDSTNGMDLCLFYSQKRDLLIDFITAEEEYRTPRVHNALKEDSIKDQYSLDRFENSLKEIAKHLNAVPGVTESDNSAFNDFITTDKKLAKSFNNFMNQMSSPKRPGNKPRTHYDQVMTSVFTKDEIPTATSRVSSTMKELTFRETPAISASNTAHSTMFEKYFNQIHYIRSKRDEGHPEKSVREVIKTMPDSFRTLLKKDEDSLTSLSSHRKKVDDRKGYLGSLTSFASPNHKTLKSFEGFQTVINSALGSPSGRSVMERKHQGASNSMSLLSGNKEKGILKYRK